MGASGCSVGLFGVHPTVADQLPSSEGTLVGDGWFLTPAWESENLGRALP